MSESIPPRPSRATRRWPALLAVFGVPAVALTLAVLAFRASAAGPPDVGLADGALKGCPPGIDCVSTEAEGERRIEPIPFRGEPEEALQALVEFLKVETGASLAEVSGLYVHALYGTPFADFVDDLELLVDPERGEIAVRAVSRSRHDDLGRNRARVAWLRERWEVVQARLFPGDDETDENASARVREEPETGAS